MHAMAYFSTTRSEAWKTVTRKITRAQQGYLGNKLFVFGQSMLCGIGGIQKTTRNAVANASARKPVDYVIATGKQYSVRHFDETAARKID